MYYIIISILYHKNQENASSLTEKKQCFWAVKLTYC